MRFNITLTSVAVVYNLINFLFGLHISNMASAASMIYVFVYPCFWIITIVAISIMAFKNRRTWFNKTFKVSTITALFLCTPISFIWFKAITAPSTYCASSGFSTEGDHTIKSEEWVYSNGRLNVIKYWKADIPDCRSLSLFRPDSVWVYLSKNGDTLQVQTYKDGKLVKERKK